ncbi:MAG: flagellar biosynthesis protein FliQ [Calditerrivibrio sp.]|nr:flagellar biosynthesis protein FliQ [Calditerrivibrio sp.]MCA1933594.1 flagellar biosynthesis protein FliQ [Calditerrivibrio sp.]MCA1980869.1 flagellar biosynthesis protein FliQ [Calditerrivibrio sp.]
MNPDMVVSLTTKTLEIALLLAAPMLIFGLVAGLIVSIFQAATQIQEMTLTFIPKILAVVLAMVIFFPWMLDVMISFTIGLFTNLNSYIGK